MAISHMSQQEQEVVAQCAAFQKIRSTGGFRSVALTILILLILLVSGLIFIPWQQSISGLGKVSVYAPMDRPQIVEAPISSRIEHWFVREGQFVEKGQRLLSLSEIDVKYLDPTQLKRMEAQRQALFTRRDATLSRIDALKHQVAFLGQSRQVAVPSAQLKVAQAYSKIAAARQGLTAAQQNATTANLNLRRIRDLHQQGLRSTRDRELAEQSAIEAQTKVQQAQAYLTIAEQDQDVAGYDQAKVSADTSAGLNATQAAIATAYETLASTQNDLEKLAVDIENLRQRTGQRQIKAPRAGIVVRIMKVGSGETVTEGDALATLMPKSTDQSVSLLISDNDAPLVAVGRPVRLQFAGWPALQFSGWPAVAVGTFAGRVAVIAAIDDGTSRYQVWVKPDIQAIRKGKEQAWPSAQYLRPGSETVGWIMLDRVPLWFELWRQFNAFPPTVSMEPLTDKKQGLKNGPKEDIKKPKKK